MCQVSVLRNLRDKKSKTVQDNAKFVQGFFFIIMIKKAKKESK
jgi:hypothetical protein